MKLNAFGVATIFFLICPLASAQDSQAESAGNLSQNTSQVGRELAVELSGTDLLNLIVSESATRVRGEIEVRESKRIAYIGSGLAALIAAIGFFGVRDLRRRVSLDIREELRTGSMLTSLVEDSVRQNITKDVSQRLDRINTEFDFINFVNLAAGLKYGNRESFSRSERDAAIAAIRKLGSQQDILDRENFSVALETIVDTFSGADLNFYVDQIDDLLPEIMADHPGIVHTLIQHYGMRVLGDITVSDELKSRFERYCEHSEKHSLTQLALPYQMVYEHSLSGKESDARIRAYLQDAGLFSEEKKFATRSLLMKNVDPNAVAKVPTGQVIRLCEKFSDFVVAYASELRDKGLILTEESEGQ